MRYVLVSARGRKQGLLIPIHRKVFTVGSSRSSQIRSVQDGIGRRHCAFVQSSEKLYLQDLESGQPTFVNGARLAHGARQLLRPGDRVAMGPMEFVVQAETAGTLIGVPFTAPPPRVAPPPPLPLDVPPPLPLAVPPMVVAVPLPLPRAPARGGTARAVGKGVALALLALVCMVVGWLLVRPSAAPKDDREERQEAKKEEKPAAPDRVAARDRKEPERPAKAPAPPPEKPAARPPRPPERPAPPKPDAPPPKPDANKVRVTFDDVLPIFRSKCLLCHSAQKKRGGLDASSVAALLRGGDNGPAIKPGSPENSLLWESVSTGQMPPNGKLTDEEKKVIRAWILGGAKDGRVASR